MAVNQPRASSGCSTTRKYDGLNPGLCPAQELQVHSVDCVCPCCVFRLHYATSLGVVSAQGFSLRCRVSVALRPLAFVASVAAPHTERITTLLRLLSMTPALRLLDHRSEAPIAVAPTVDAAGRAAGATKMAKTKDAMSAEANRVLDAVEKLSAHFSEEADPPPGLRVTLHPFQLKTLAWMLSQERADSADVSAVRTQLGRKLWYGRGQFHLYCPARGGFVMQDMGMGKTVEMIALILSNPPPAGAAGTLVVCPVSLLANWQTELSKLLPSSAKVFVLDSAAKKKASATNLLRYDVIITAYTLLAKGMDAVYELDWHRLVLDESVLVKNPKSVAATTIASIRSPRRWCLSGTPLPTGCADLTGQLVALQMTPYDHQVIFRTRLSTTANGLWVSNGNAKHAKLHSPQPILKLLAMCAIRHRKDGMAAAGGEALVSLPPLSIEERMLTPSEADAAAYGEVHAEIAERVAALTRGGSLSSKVARLISLLLKLRVACDHPSLARESIARMRAAYAEARQVASEAGVPEKSLADALSEARSKPPRQKAWLEALLLPYTQEEVEVPECSICLDEMLTPTITSCDLPHAFCLTCVLDCMRKGANGELVGKCPICRAPIRQSGLCNLKVGMDDAPPEAQVDVAEARAEDSPLGSTKFDALVALLRERPTEHPKSVVFIQFAATQALVLKRLKAEGISYATISPGATQPQRAKALHAFTGDPSVKVFVLSMKTAAVGLTLTCASRLILLEPGLSVADEAQAIGRVHRFGQQRNVQVVKFALRATVEERILDMNRVASAESDGAQASTVKQAAQKQFTGEQVLRLLGMEVAGTAAGPSVVEID